MKAIILSGDGNKVGYITTDPSFDFSVDFQHPLSDILKQTIDDSGREVTVRTGEMEDENMVTPPEEYVSVSGNERFRIAVSNIKSNLPFRIKEVKEKKSVKEKYRRYINDPSEAPEDAEVQETEQEGAEHDYWYETEGIEGDGQPEESDQNDVISSAKEGIESLTFSNFEEVRFGDTEQVAKDYMEQFGSKIKDDEILHNFFSRINEVKNDVPQSGYQFTDNTLYIRGGSDNNTMYHESGHILLANHGKTIHQKGNILSHLYQHEIPDVEWGETVREYAKRNNLDEKYDGGSFGELMDEHGDLEITKDFCKLKQEDADNPEIIERYAEEVNQAWERMWEAEENPDKDAEDFYINKPYSMTNAHEVSSMMTETMQGSFHPQTIKEVYEHHTSLVDVYTEIMEPSEMQRKLLNWLHQNAPDKSPWEDTPYPDDGVISMDGDNE